MVSPDLFARLGLFVDESFLDSSVCRRVVQEMRSATRKQAEVHTAEHREQVKEALRRANKVKPPAAVRSLVGERLDLLTPRLQEAFGVALSGFEPPQFLTYGSGDFHQAHTDAGSDAAAQVARRKVSVVVFLNDQSEEPREGSYGGGVLALGGIIPGFGDETRGFPIALPAGSVFAFRSDVIHEVKPVTHGERFTIVSWFY